MTLLSNSAQTASNPIASLTIRPSAQNYNFSFEPESGGLDGAFDMTPLMPFARRLNPDKSIDSICTKCFQTIASEDSESELIAHEIRHSCDLNWTLTRAHLDSRRSISARPSLNSLS